MGTGGRVGGSTEDKALGTGEGRRGGWGGKGGGGGGEDGVVVVVVVDVMLLDVVEDWKREEKTERLSCVVRLALQYANLSAR